MWCRINSVCNIVFDSRNHNKTNKIFDNYFIVNCFFVSLYDYKTTMAFCDKNLFVFIESDGKQYHGTFYNIKGIHIASLIALKYEDGKNIAQKHMKNIKIM